MPIYEYKCECGKEGESNLPLAEYDQPQICECGKVMQRKMSAPNFVMKPTGKDMALDSLNSKWGGFPEGQTKPWAQQAAAEGL